MIATPVKLECTDNLGVRWGRLGTSAMVGITGICAGAKRGFTHTLFHDAY
jgi:hypothetical protein